MAVEYSRGKFSFDQGDTGRKAKAAGFFINDKQVGKWTWDYPIRNGRFMIETLIFIVK